MRTMTAEELASPYGQKEKQTTEIKAMGQESMGVFLRRGSGPKPPAAWTPDAGPAQTETSAAPRSRGGQCRHSWHRHSQHAATQTAKCSHVSGPGQSCKPKPPQSARGIDSTCSTSLTWLRLLRHPDSMLAPSLTQSLQRLPAKQRKLARQHMGEHADSVQVRPPKCG